MQAATQLLKRVVNRLLSDVVQSSGPGAFLVVLRHFLGLGSFRTCPPKVNFAGPLSKTGQGLESTYLSPTYLNSLITQQYALAQATWDVRHRSSSRTMRNPNPSPENPKHHGIAQALNTNLRISKPCWSLSLGP